MVPLLHVSVGCLNPEVKTSFKSRGESLDQAPVKSSQCLNIDSVTVFVFQSFVTGDSVKMC